MYFKVFNIIIHQGKANRNYFEIPSHLYKMTLKKSNKYKYWKECEKN